MNRYVSSLLALLTCVGCSNAEAPATSGVADPPTGSPTKAAVSRGAESRGTGLAGRTEELAQPDEATLVFLYHDLAQIPPPIDTWVERDSRVQMARPADKAAMRDRVRAEMTAGMRAVANIGSLRISLDPKLSDYDPSYQEFTVQAFAPSSVLQYRAFDERVQIKFRNARAAQTWQVAADEAQSIRDKLGYYGATADVLLTIVGVQPGPDAGVILTDVVEYDLRGRRNGQLIGRVKVAQ